jgi:hypothetical protein
MATKGSKVHATKFYREWLQGQHNSTIVDRTPKPIVLTPEREWRVYEMYVRQFMAGWNISREEAILTFAPADMFPVRSLRADPVYQKLVAEGRLCEVKQ